MAMERIHDRLYGHRPESKNYIQRLWGTMTKKVQQGIEKAESDKTKTQFWATITMTVIVSILVPFFAWLAVHLENYGEQKGEQKAFEFERKTLNEKIAEQNKIIEALKVQMTAPVVPQPAQPQRTRRRKPGGRIQGQSNNASVANTYANMHYPR